MWKSCQSDSILGVEENLYYKNCSEKLKNDGNRKKLYFFPKF